MANWVKNSLWILSILLAGALLPDFCHKQTKGFEAGKIVPSFTPDPQEDLSLQAENQEEISKALNQPFHYLKKGNSAFVFISEDQKYVIKFLRSSKISPPLWATWKPVNWLFPSYCQNLIFKKNTQKQIQLTSYKLADGHLKDQTGILYSHLYTSSHLKTKITFYDYIKVKHSLPADSTAFLLQKKAEPFCPYFKTLVKQKKKEEIDALLKQFASLLHERALKGIFDRDISPHYNLGILDGKFMAFDLDGLKPCITAPSSAIDIQRHMLQDGKKMILWLEHIDSEFSFCLEEEIYKLSLLS